MNTKHIFILFFAGLLAFTVGCSKVDGFYDFENKESLFNGNAIQYYQSKANVYDSLLLVLNRLPEYTEAIKEGNLTLFSPTNASFQLAMNRLNIVRQNQGKSTLTLNTVALPELDLLLSKYIVKGLQSTDSMMFVDGLYVETLKNEQPMHAQRIKQDASGYKEGGLVTVYYSDTKNSTFEMLWTRAATQAVNIRTSNCIIHVLSNNHEFGFGEFLTRMNTNN